MSLVSGRYADRGRRRVRGVMEEREVMKLGSIDKNYTKITKYADIF